jgi:hypothetical protein
MASLESSAWPALPYGQWRDTRDTLQLWTQIVGKIRLQQTPWMNHGWHVALYVTARGLSTSVIHYGERSFEMLFDFNNHALRIDVSDGAHRQVALRARSVADFHGAVLQQLADLDMPVTINEWPCEIAGATPLSSDRTHAAYDPEYARRFWHALLQCDRVLKQFRTGFIGKSSPVHFFWGSFDLAVTRFSGRPAPAFSGKVPGVAATVMREAYSHEVSSAGFWPGGNGIDYPAFYSYAYPVPPEFHQFPVMPESAFFSDTLGEFVLPYETVRTAPDPDATLLAFLQTTYEAAAETAHWDRASLDRPLGIAGQCPDSA